MNPRAPSTRSWRTTFSESSAASSDGITMIIVTHEIAFAREVADRMVFMDGGLIVEVGDPATLITNPQSPRTKEFLSRVL